MDYKDLIPLQCNKFQKAKQQMTPFVLFLAKGSSYVAFTGVEVKSSFIYCHLLFAECIITVHQIVSFMVQNRGDVTSFSICILLLPCAQKS